MTSVTAGDYFRLRTKCLIWDEVEKSPQEALNAGYRQEGKPVLLGLLDISPLNMFYGDDDTFHHCRDNVTDRLSRTERTTAWVAMEGIGSGLRRIPVSVRSVAQLFFALCTEGNRWKPSAKVHAFRPRKSTTY